MASTWVRRGAWVPASPLNCALALAEPGSDDQRALRLSGVASGEQVLAAAIAEDLVALPERPLTTARRTHDGWVLNGTKTLVRAGLRADLLLVTASTADGVDVFLVESGKDGVTAEAQRTTDGDVAARVELTDVSVAHDAPSSVEPGLPPGSGSCSPSLPARSSSESPKVRWG